MIENGEYWEGVWRPGSPGSAVDGVHLVAAPRLQGVEQDGGHVAHLVRRGGIEGQAAHLPPLPPPPPPHVSSYTNTREEGS